MKSFLNQIAIGLLITSLAGVAAFAKTNKQKVTLDTAMKINGTVVNKGTYDLKFDDATGELSIIKGNKVLARATASAEKRDSKARRFALRSSGSGDELVLTGVTFEGADHDLKLGGTQASR